MTDLLISSYPWIKALHVVAVIAWMAGLLYLPRLYVYHAQAELGSEVSETLKVMERRLLKAIMNPAMIVAWLMAILMLVATPEWISEGWMHVKLLCVIGLTAAHMLQARWRRVFANDQNMHGHRFYRIANEVPTLLMVVIVIMVVVKPF